MEYMKRKTFNLMVIGTGSVFTEVPCYDYDEKLQVVRYKDVIYDIPTGLWVVTLRHIQKDWGHWKGCGKFPDANCSTMMSYVVSNGIFKLRLEKQRKKVLDNKLAEVMNKDEEDLFSFM